ncbi:MAG: hypothetical protein LUD18_02350 [Lachnospiraceae bacterium]|nr:hypothetical protein [Lachnospiraceae bacterium]
MNTDFLERHQGVVNALKGLAAVIVIVGILAALGIFKTAAVSVKIEDEVFTVSYEDEIVIRFAKDELQSAEVVTSFDMGDAIDAVSEDKYIVGTWENDEWGQYTLCVKKSLECYLVVATETEVFVFNYESRDTTESMCSALLAW